MLDVEDGEDTVDDDEEDEEVVEVEPDWLELVELGVVAPVGALATNA